MNAIALSFKSIGILAAALAITLSARLAVGGGGSGEGEAPIAPCGQFTECLPYSTPPIYEGEVILQLGKLNFGTEISVLFVYTKPNKPLKQTLPHENKRNLCTISLPPPPSSPDAYENQLFIPFDGKLEDLTEAGLKGLCIPVSLLQEAGFISCPEDDPLYLGERLQTFDVLKLRKPDNKPKPGKSDNEASARIVLITLSSSPPAD